MPGNIEKGVEGWRRGGVGKKRKKRGKKKRKRKEKELNV